LGKTDLGYIQAIMNISIILSRKFLRFSWALRLLKYCRNIVTRAYRPQHYLHFQIVAWMAGIYQTKHKFGAASQLFKEFPNCKKTKRKSTSQTIKRNCITRAIKGRNFIESFISYQ